MTRTLLTTSNDARVGEEDGWQLAGWNSRRRAHCLDESITGASRLSKRYRSECSKVVLIKSTNRLEPGKTTVATASIWCFDRVSSPADMREAGNFIRP